MGGNSGGIIIRSKLRAAAETDTVKENISTAKRERLLNILCKTDADWSDDETHFVRRCIGIAYDNIT